MGLTRRQVLGGLLGAAGSLLLLPARPLQAIGPGSLFRVARLQLPGLPPARPGAERRLVWELLKRTSVAGDLDEVTVTPESAALYDHPFLLLAGEEAFPPLTAAAVTNLERFLRLGGLLCVDSCGTPEGGGFDRSLRQALRQLFPQHPLRPVGADHTLYRSFYLLDRPYGRLLAKSYLEGIELDGRLVVVDSQNDLPGAWARDPLGSWLYPVEPGDERQREMALRTGVNLAMYALCLDYKKDQVHVETLLRQRRWRPQGRE